jgi:internalin A
MTRPRLSALLLCTLTAYAFAPADDDVATWIRDVGGSVVRGSGGEITEVDLTSTWTSDDDLVKVGRLKQLRKLDLSYTKVSDRGLENLRPLQNVVSLNCYYCEYISDGGIAYLKQWDKLEYLNLRGTEVTSKVFEHLAKMRKLKTLDVGFSRVNDDGFDALASLEELSELHIGGDKMSGLALPLLRLLPSLTHLDVNGSQRTDSGRWGLMLSDLNVDSLSALTQLRSLNMGGALVTDVGMKFIEPMVALEELNLSRMDITAQALAPLTKLPKLRRLNVSQSDRIDDKASQFVLRLPKLEALDLSETRITDELLDQISTLKQLKVLVVAGTKVTPAGLERFRKARPDCKLIYAPAYKEVKSEEDTRLIG